MEYKILLDMKSTENQRTNILFSTANRDSIRFIIRVEEDGKEVIYQNFDVAILFFRRENASSENLCEILSSEIICDLKPNDYNSSGEIFCELWLYKGKVKSTPLFFSFKAQKSIVPGSFVNSVNQSDRLDQEFAEAQELIDGLNAMSSAIRETIPQIKLYTLTIPVSNWQARDGGGYFAEEENEMLQEVHHVDISFDMESLEAAAACGMASDFEVLDGKLRFEAEHVPGATLTGEYMVIALSGSLIAMGTDLSAYTASNADIELLLSTLS